MINIILVISLTLNIIFIIVAYFYIKYKVLGINKLKKESENKFCTDEELDNMLDRL